MTATQEIIRIAPTILAQAFAELVARVTERATVTQNPEAMIGAALHGFELLYHGISLTRSGGIWTFTIDDQRHAINGTCSCGQICTARAAKRLVQIVDMLQPSIVAQCPESSGYPCIHCNTALQAGRTPAGESAYSCPTCCWTVASAQIGETMIANGRCGHCGHLLAIADHAPLDQMLYACPQLHCAGHDQLYTYS